MHIPLTSPCVSVSFACLCLFFFLYLSLHICHYASPSIAFCTCSVSSLLTCVGKFCLFSPVVGVIPISYTSISIWIPSTLMPNIAEHFPLLKSVYIMMMMIRCVICQLKYKIGEKQMNLPCKHVYHSDCISKWLSINKVLLLIICSSLFLHPQFN